MKTKERVCGKCKEVIPKGERVWDMLTAKGMKHYCRKCIGLGKK